MILATLLVALGAASPQPTEVRQLVTFKFLPGKAAEASAIFRDDALPLYEDNAPMLKFRGYREAESPEPVDLVVVSTFDGMAGMDASNRALRRTAEEHGTSIGELYGRIGALSQHHRDEFIEIHPNLSWGSDDGELTVLISLRIEPGQQPAFEQLLKEGVIPWEKELDIGLSGSESGPFLLSNGWDYFRILQVRTLEDWHAYVREWRGQPWSQALDRVVSLSKQLILVPVPELSVR